MKWMVELVKVNGCRGNNFDEFNFQLYIEWGENKTRKS